MSSFWSFVLNRAANAISAAMKKKTSKRSCFSRFKLMSNAATVMTDEIRDSATSRFPLAVSGVDERC